MENLHETLVAKFLSQFPDSFISIKKSALFNPDKPSYAMYIALKNSNWPNNIIQNDVMYHVITLHAENDKIQLELQTGGLSVKPKQSYLACTVLKTNLRKKTGTESQLINHFNKWVDNLKTMVIENKNDLYGIDYQNFII
jgi:hypothetical protein